MKTIVRMTVILLIGIAFGWYLGFTRLGLKAGHEAGSRQAREEADAINAALDSIHAIRLAESGNKQEAMAYFARPIGWYYRMYASQAGTNKERLELRTQIEKLAGSNAVVAAEIQKKAQ